MAIEKKCENCAIQFNGNNGLPNWRFECYASKYGYCENFIHKEELIREDERKKIFSDLVDKKN